MNIPGLRGLGPWTVLKRSLKDFFDDKMMTYAAALAYQVLFAIFPFVIFLVALLGFLNLSDFFDWLLQQAQVVLPRTAMASVRQVVDEIRARIRAVCSPSGSWPPSGWPPPACVQRWTR